MVPNPFNVYLPGGRVTDPQGTLAGSLGHPVRGGTFASPAVLCRSAQRDDSSPGNNSFQIGFRVVLAPSQ